MKLIVEDVIEQHRATIVESVVNDGEFHPIKFLGPMSFSDRATKNKRLYPYKILKEQYDRFIREDVANRCAFGCLEHPLKNLTELEEHENAAIFITNVEERDGGEWFGEAVLMQSDPIHGIPGSRFADVAATLISYSGNKNLFGFSTRGYGDLSEENSDGNRVLTSYLLKTVDLVSKPANNTYAEGILESKEFMVDMHGQIVECALNQYERDINSSTKTFDLDKKREIYKAAFDTLLKKL